MDGFKTVTINLSTAKLIVDEWFSRWHRFAEENDRPSQRWKEFIESIECATGENFDWDTGGWVVVEPC